MSWNPLIVHVVAFDDTGDSAYRMQWPTRDIAAAEPELAVVTVNADAAERFDLARQADLLVLIQSSDIELLPIVKARRAAGRATLVEYNDNFFEPPPWAPVAKAWASPLLQALYADFMLSADAVMTTSPKLAQLFQRRIGELRDISVVANYLPQAPASLEQLEAGKTTYPSLGWAGSLGHIADILAFAPQLLRTLAEIPESKIHIMGNSALPALLGIPSERLVFTPWSSIDAYFTFWADIRVGVAALLPSAYNQCRSDIKAVEISSCGVAPVLSDIEPYRDFATLCDLKLQNDFISLGDAARELLKKPQLAQAVAARAHAFVSRQRVGVASTERLALYKRLLEKSRVEKKTHTPGLQHINGEPKPRKPLVELIRKTQELLKSGEADQALTLLRAQVQECAFDGDIVLLYLKCLIVTGRTDVYNELSLARARFPQDLRFELLELQLLGSEIDKLIVSWSELLDRILNHPKKYEVFSAEIVSLLGAQLERYPQLIDLAKRALEMYPQGVSLRFRLAEALRRANNDQEALVQYQQLRDQRRQAAFLRELEALEIGYLEAWVAALTARTNQPLS